MSAQASAVLATFAVSAISLVGIVFYLVRRPSSRGEAMLLSFAAGVLLSTSFLELAPEAVEHAGGDGRVFAASLVAIIGFFLLERFLHGFHGHEGGHHGSASRWLILIGDGVHNFIDGVVIAASFAVSPEVGVVTTLAVAVHEVPQELADFSILVAGGFDRRTALVLNFLTALTAAVGALAFFALTSVLQANVAWFMTATLGMFVYIAGSDLIPQLHQHDHEGSPLIYLTFLGGVGLIAVLSAMLQH